MNSILLTSNWLVALYIFLFGLCVGSFLNVVILRGLKGENFISGRSKCPKCKSQLKWYMNIPLLSYIFLKGKCAFCKTKISIQYPIVELITASAFLISYFAFGLTLKFVFISLLLVFFILMSATDLIEMVIIDTHAYILLILALLYSIFKLNNIGIVEAIIGAVFGFFIFEIMARIGKFFCGCRMFGEGDSLIALGLGAIFGWKSLLIVICLSILIQGICSIPLLIKQSFAQEKNRLAFSYIIVIFSIVTLVLTNYFNLANNQTSYLGVVILTTSGLLWSLKNIILEIKNKKNMEVENEEDKFCLMPFGPALLIAGAIAIFYLPQIKSYILYYLI